MYFTRFIKSSQFQRIKNSKIAADSFWAVFGNGFGYALLLLSGIIIARFLGKDVYGEYGMVKSTMLYIAGFATMGLGITSTKYIAEFIKKDNTQIKSLARDAMFITLIASSVIAILLAIFAHPLANYLDTPTLALPFQILGCLIIFKAITTTQNGILAGFSNFKIIARNNVVCSIYMLAAAAPLTYFFGLKGALAALLSTQAMNCILNYIKLHALLSSLQNQVNVNRKKELFLFSFPIAIQESSYTICQWGGTILLVKMSSIGELGIFSAVSQWNAIITFIPGLLSNVILSHLSSSIDDSNRHNKTIKLMLCVNLACTLTPFAIIYFWAPWVATFYGTSFHGMTPVLRVYTFCTIFTCCSNIFTSELIVTHHNWLLMIIRFFRDCSIFLLAIVFLYRSKGAHGALYYAWANVIVSALYILTLAGVYKFKIKKD
ncbi:oligosaccharide flippase family protein [uncultured Duncaniella sp.]|uniref:oligosaccharide flippase family protein n=3 Tax=Muribaculaceae TaxID=2005473 RepID=UPI00262CA5BE|nr:oligosaccharide flippase family protein [uncultured Duncaniella sp.]